jgi:hypothetical protein
VGVVVASERRSGAEVALGRGSGARGGGRRQRRRSGRRLGAAAALVAAAAVVGAVGGAAGTGVARRRRRAGVAGTDGHGGCGGRWARRLCWPACKAAATV